MTCKMCDGRGVVRTHPHQHDPTDYSDCPTCVTHDKCPLCDMRFAEVNEYGKCRGCGWVWDDSKNFEHWSQVPLFDNASYGDAILIGAKIA